MSNSPYGRADKCYRRAPIQPESIVTTPVLTSPGILLRLKRETLEHHAAVQDQLDLFGRVRTLGDYRRHLMRLYGFYFPLEARLARIASSVGFEQDFDARRKTLLLRHDLLSLGADQGQIASIALCLDLPDVDDLAQALGCLYVLEGATLGGQVIIRHFEQRLAITAEDGGRFFASYGAKVGEQWKALRAMLETRACTVDMQDSIVLSACATFGAFGRWFEQGGSS